MNFTKLSNNEKKEIVDLCTDFRIAGKSAEDFVEYYSKSFSNPKTLFNRKGEMILSIFGLLWQHITLTLFYEFEDYYNITELTLSREEYQKDKPVFNKQNMYYIKSISVVCQIECKQDKINDIVFPFIDTLKELTYPIEEEAANNALKVQRFMDEHMPNKFEQMNNAIKKMVVNLNYDDHVLAILGAAQIIYYNGTKAINQRTIVETLTDKPSTLIDRWKKLNIYFYGDAGIFENSVTKEIILDCQNYKPPSNTLL